MAIPLDTTLCTLQIVPAVVAIAQGKDPTTKTIAGVAVALALVVGFGRYVGLDLGGDLFRILCAVLAVASIAAAVRFRQPILATLMITGGLLLAAGAFGLVR